MSSFVIPTEEKRRSSNGSGESTHPDSVEDRDKDSKPAPTWPHSPSADHIVDQQELEQRTTTATTSPQDSSSCDPSPSPHRQHEHNQTDAPPDGGYGWVVVVCVALINAHTWGLNSSYSVFLAYYLSTSYIAASRLSFAFIGGLSISQALLISPLATACVPRLGTRAALAIGVVLQTASFVGASFSRRLWQLLLSQGLCFGWGLGFLFVASVGIPAQWFTSRRSLANATAAAGSGLGGLVYSLAAQRMIRTIGLPWAFRVLGLVSGLVNLVATLLVRDRNKALRARHAPFDHALFARPDFLLLSAWGVLSMLGYIVLIFSLASYAQSVGMSPRQGSVVSAILNLGQMLGRPPIGYFSDAMGRLNMASVMTCLCGLFSLAIWVPADSFGLLVFFALLGGTVAGTFWATIAPVAAEVFDLQQLPSVLNITWVVIVLPTTFSEAIALEIVRFNGGSYRGAQLFTGFMYLGAASFLWILRARKLGAMERKRVESGELARPSSFLARTTKWARV